MFWDAVLVCTSPTKSFEMHSGMSHELDCGTEHGKMNCRGISLFSKVKCDSDGLTGLTLAGSESSMNIFGINDQHVRLE